MGKSDKFSPAKGCKTLIFGDSHGGYLGLLCAKFAPWLVDVVVENSSYVSVSPQYIGFGKELDYTKYYETHNNAFENIVLQFYSKHLWNTDRALLHFFSSAHNRIRNVLDSVHLQVAAEHFKSKITSYHGLHDAIAPVKQKYDLHELLAALGFENRLFVASESDIDGKFIKKFRPRNGNVAQNADKKGVTATFRGEIYAKKGRVARNRLSKRGFKLPFQREFNGGIDLVIERHRV